MQHFWQRQIELRESSRLASSQRRDLRLFLRSRSWLFAAHWFPFRFEQKLLRLWSLTNVILVEQILINVVWMIIAPSHAKHHYPTREDNLLVCDSYIDASYMIAFFFPIVLIVVCTVYAVLTRKIPEAFNESKHIGFTMYTTCVIWLAFVPLYFATANTVPLRITSMSVTISLSALVCMACLFTPKVRIFIDTFFDDFTNRFLTALHHPRSTWAECKTEHDGSKSL